MIKAARRRFMNSVDRHPKRFVAIDGNSLVHRAFHAFPPELATSAGVQVNAVYGFTSMLLRVLSELKPKYLLCAFDKRGPTFRHLEFAGYKAKRKPTDDTLVLQFPIVKEVLKAFNVPILEMDGYEADDVLGTIGERVSQGKWSEDGMELIIVTGDKDLLQVVGGNVKVWLPHGSFKDLVMYDEKAVRKKYGFGPERVPDYKALVGDPSDNIPGVKGIGDKSATKLITEFGTLEGIYKNIEKVPARVKNILVEGEESAAISLRLAQIVKDVPIEVRLEDCLMKDFNRDNVLVKFQELEFHSLISRIPESISSVKGEQMGFFGAGCPKPGDKKGESCSGVKPIDELDVKKLLSDTKVDRIGIAFFSSGELMLGVDRGEEIDGYYCANVMKGVSLEDIVLPVLLGSKVPVVSYGWEDFCRTIYGHELSSAKKLELVNFAETRLLDIGLAAYFISGGLRDYTLTSLAFRFASFVVPESELQQLENCALCLQAVFAVACVMEKELAKHFESMGSMFGEDYNPITENPLGRSEMPLALSLAEMTARGISVDVGMLEKMNEELEENIIRLRKNIYEAVGHEFNILSSRQLADVLFNELKLTVYKRTKTGFSTAEDVLQKLKAEHPCVVDVLSYRELVKIKGTYIDPLVRYARESKDGRIHSTFSQVVTSTGRLSSVNPNLQTIPVRSDLGKRVKETFVAAPGKVLVSADYSQIELRIMAHFSQDRLMMQDFAGGADFHKSTAARIFDKKEQDVTDDERRVAKTINFGVMYGLSAFGLSETLGIEREDAAKYIQEYFEKYPDVRMFLEKTIDFVKARGYVESLLGRRRYITGVLSSNRMAKAAYEREAINMPLQGTAADIVRLAMNEVYKWVLQQKHDIGFLLQIHDQLVLECDEKEADEVCCEVKKIMEGVVKLSVPLEVNMGYGKSMNSMSDISR